MRVASWNVNSLKVRLPQVLDWLAAHSPDVLGLQETKLVDAAFPLEAIRAAGYEVSFSGQPTYNGVALLSRAPQAEVVTGLDGLDDPQRRVLGATVGGVRVLNLYVPNGQEVGSEKYAYKLAWLEGCARSSRRAGAAPAHDRHGRLQHRAGRPRRARPRGLGRQGAVQRAGARRAGADPGAGVRGHLPPVRAAGGRVQLVGLPRGGLPAQPRPAHRPGAREPALAGACTRSWVDIEPRRNERPSDHAPAVAVFDLDD
jgi:exodeoxyribonuclease III